jgi:hypothetical protein
MVKQRLKDQFGFSLVEVFFSLGILITVLFAFFKLPTLFKTSETSVVNIVTKDRLFKGFSQAFIEIAERADVALRFQNMPIPAMCEDKKPCVRQFTSDNKMNPVALDGVEGVQMLRDEQGSMHDVEVFNTPITGTTPTLMGMLRQRKPLVLQPSFLAGGYYATWPLVTSKSEPFVLLRRSNLSESFFVENAFVISSSTSRWIMVRGSRSGVDIAPMVGKAMVAYNPSDPTQYTIQKVMDGFDCKARMEECKTLGRTILGINVDYSVAKYGPNSTTFENTPFYAILLEPFQKADLQFTAKDNEPRNFLPNSGFVPTDWKNQDSGPYLFPSSVFSLFSPPDGENIDFRAPADIKRLSHFMHTTGSVGETVLMPLDIVAFRVIETPVDRSGKVKRSLKLQTFGSQSSVAVLDDIADGDQVIFARRLGQPELAVFQLR